MVNLVSRCLRRLYNKNTGTVQRFWVGLRKDNTKNIPKKSILYIKLKQDKQIYCNISNLMLGCFALKPKYYSIFVCLVFGSNRESYTRCSFLECVLCYGK